MNDTTKRTASYLELTSQGYAMMIDAAASANQRALGYTKSLYEIASRPFASGAPDATVRDGFDRFKQIADLTVTELRTAATKNAEFAERFVAQTNAVQEQVSHAVHGVAATGLSNISYVREATETQINGFTKRVEDIQNVGGKAAK
ncbi:MAG: hypothetical protein ABI346_09065 [Candidatus Baltobacteraceae bacterium]